MRAVASTRRGRVWASSDRVDFSGWVQKMICAQCFDYLSLGRFFLGPFDVQRSRMTVAAMAMKAKKLLSVLQDRVAIPRNSLSFPKKFSIRCRHL